MDFIVPLGEELLSSIRRYKKFLDRQEDRWLSTTTQSATGKQNFFLNLKQAGSTRQVPEAKRFCIGDSHSKLSKRKTCVDLFQSIKNSSVLLEGFTQLTSQDRPCLVTQIVCNCLPEYPKLHDRIEQHVLLMDWIDFQNMTVRIELPRVNQGVNILETS